MRPLDTELNNLSNGADVGLAHGTIFGPLAPALPPPLNVLVGAYAIGNGVLGGIILMLHWVHCKP